MNNNNQKIENGTRMSVTDNSIQHSNSEQQLFDAKLTVPDFKTEGFSFAKLWFYGGPGLLMSIAFLDPGNIAADLQSGLVGRYQLLWVLLWSTIIGLFMQRLSARVGTVTGKHLAELCTLHYQTPPRIVLWLMLETAIIATDMQEVIGASVAIYILSQKKIPIWIGVIITITDTFTILTIEKFKLRKVEFFFAFLVTTMAISFGYEFFISNQDPIGIISGVLIPVCYNCGKRGLMQVTGLIGSSIQPQNLYLHSGLVKTRDIDRTQSKKISEANFYYLIESGIALFIAFILNSCVLSVFASGLFGKTNVEILEVCQTTNNSFSDVYQNNTEPVGVDIFSAGVFLGCEYGAVAIYIWAIGLLASGQSGTMCGCYSGQFVMEGMLNITWTRWKRIVLTRSIAIFPTIYVAKFTTLTEFSQLNDLINSYLTMQLPFAMLPLITFTSDRRIMGEFVNGRTVKILAFITFITILLMNSTFIFEFSKLVDNLWKQILVIIYSIIYICLLIYLVLHTISTLSGSKSYINKLSVIRKYVVKQH